MSKLTIVSILILCICTWSIQAVGNTESVGTTLNYQGQLSLNDQSPGQTVNLVFRLYDSADGGNLLGEIAADSTELHENGLFSVNLDFGNVFSGQPRWLEIEVDSEVLSPRQLITATPHAMVSSTVASVPPSALIGEYGGVTGVGTLEFLDVDGNVGIGTPAQPWAKTLIETPSDDVFGLYVYSTDPDQPNTGVVSSMAGSGAIGMIAESTSPDSSGVGILANTSGSEGIAVFGRAQHDSGNSFAIAGSNSSPNGYAAFFTGAAGSKNYFQRNVGIGTLDPQYLLHVHGGNIFSSSGSWAIRGVKTGSGTFPGVWGQTHSQSSGASGVRGVVESQSPGSNSAGVYGHNHGTSSSGMGVRGLHDGGGAGVHGQSASGAGVNGHSASGAGIHGQSVSGAGVRGITEEGSYGGIFGSLDSPGGIMTIGDSAMIGNVGIGTFSPQDVLHIVGTTRTDVLRITGGSDLSERFDIANALDLSPEPGMVVSIDPDNPGKLIPSTSAYDRTVAGVISGANGINSGMVMGQEDSIADGAYPVALTGRVFAMVDAGTRAVYPGDLLTTSDTPGHAMPVDDYTRMHGAVIGKAMTPLAHGEQGLVLVLINLQ